MGYPQRNPANTANELPRKTRNKNSERNQTVLFEIIPDSPPVAIRRSVYQQEQGEQCRGIRSETIKGSPSLAPLNTSFGQQCISRKNRRSYQFCQALFGNSFCSHTPPISVIPVSSSLFYDFPEKVCSYSAPLAYALLTSSLQRN